LNSLCLNQSSMEQLLNEWSYRYRGKHLWRCDFIIRWFWYYGYEYECSTQDIWSNQLNQSSGKDRITHAKVSSIMKFCAQSIVSTRVSWLPCVMHKLNCLYSLRQLSMSYDLDRFWFSPTQRLVVLVLYWEPCSHFKKFTLMDDIIVIRIYSLSGSFDGSHMSNNTSYQFGPPVCRLAPCALSWSNLSAEKRSGGKKDDGSKQGSKKSKLDFCI
jgi:hypothetical protein